VSNGLQITDNFEDYSNVAITYNGDGSINTVILYKYIAGHGYKKKTYTFTYTGDSVETINVTVEDNPPA
jgi:hypothetical protein